LRTDELLSGASGAVKDEDGVGDASVGIDGGLAVSRVVQVQRGKSFAGFELEVVNDEVTFGGFGHVLRKCGGQ